MPNLVLRIGFALAIVGAAIGMTAAASETMARCDAALAEPSVEATMVCSAPADSAGRVAAAPADAVRVSAVSSDHATMLVGLATAVVFFSLFAILIGYRQRPGGVRASHR
jgi:hypothetical protein